MDDKQTQRTVPNFGASIERKVKGTIRLQNVKRIKLPFVPPRAEKEEKSFVLGYN